MDLNLTFANGNLSGDGMDDVGRFLIRGRYDAASRECYWTKRYLGAHDVFYRGFREGKGIWGTWEITIHLHGGFHIWPRGSDEGEASAETAEAEEPVDAIAKQEVTASAARVTTALNPAPSLTAARDAAQGRAEKGPEQSQTDAKGSGGTPARLSIVPLLLLDWRRLRLSPWSGTRRRLLGMAAVLSPFPVPVCNQPLPR